MLLSLKTNERTEKSRNRNREKYTCDHVILCIAYAPEQHKIVPDGFMASA